MSFKNYIFILFLSIINISGYSQDSLYNRLTPYSYIILDPIVVKEVKRGFNIEDFISMVKSDTSFYSAFKNLRYISYTNLNEIKYFNNKNRVIASQNNLLEQSYKSGCREMELIYSEAKGKYLKKGKPRFYTSRVFEKLFFTKGRVCKKRDLAILSDKPKSKIDKHILELKKLIFLPGQKADVPFIGNKTAIFSKKMSKKYNFYINSTEFRGVKAYEFIAAVKPESELLSSEETVVKILKTYFSKEDFQILGRDYTLAYEGLAFQFDVAMRIELTKINEMYLPTIIKYKGYWNIPIKKKEASSFIMKFYNFTK